jgi:glutamate racemase
VYPIEAPGLVELVEAGAENSPAALELLQRLLGSYAGKLDALVLGCTHYPFAEKAISAVLGDTTALLDGGDGTARETRRRLTEAELLAQPLQEGSLLIQCSGDTNKFRNLAEKLLNR